jgi:hypothetical protein
VHWFPSPNPVGVVMSMRAPWSAANLSIIRALRCEDPRFPSIADMRFAAVAMMTLSLS